jgi:prophage antirepressor-like protein
MTVWKGIRGKTLYLQVRHIFSKFDSVLTFISRPGLFKLIQRSNKPEARELDRWVRHEVLPQIMDNGGYVMPDADG